MTSPRHEGIKASRHQGIHHPLALGLVLNIILSASALAALFHGNAKYLEYLPQQAGNNTR